MGSYVTSVTIKNYKCLRELTVPCGPVNVLFGPNGAGKSTFLDALSFVSDCASLGVSGAIRKRHYETLINDRAGFLDDVSIEIGDLSNSYTLTIRNPQVDNASPVFPAEQLVSKKNGEVLFQRKFNSAIVNFSDLDVFGSGAQLRDPDYLALQRYYQFSAPLGIGISVIQGSIKRYISRETDIIKTKNIGSESSHHTALSEDWKNLWSAMRNLHDKRAVDGRYATILGFMADAFPTFRDMVFDQLGPSRVYASFLEKYRKRATGAASVSDGYIQLIGLLTALFGEPAEHASIISFDEPETSLHPHAIAVFAKAVKLAVEKWNRQIFIATHSPVLLGQFEPEQILVFGTDDEQSTTVKKLSEVDSIRDLLAQYDVGSLYMAEAIAPQSANGAEKSHV